MESRILHTLLVVPSLVSLALAQAPDPKQPAPARPPAQPLAPDTRSPIDPAPLLPKPPVLDAAQTNQRLPQDRLYVSAQADGSPQVRGLTYKAEFTPAGACYIPFCGAAAPASHPLTLHLSGIRSGGEPLAFANDTGARIEGSTVRYERGSLSEVYVLALDSIEQRFVFESLPSRGELVLRLDCTTDMSAARDGAAILYSSADGTLRYGAATVLDASGASAPAATELVEGGLEIRVSAQFLATASFPVTIDPLISTFGVSWFGTGPDDFAPAIAWDESNQRYCVVYEEVFSASDHDVISVFLSPTGVFQSGGYVDGNLSAYWADPDVANNNYANQFFVVAEVGSPSGGTRAIHGRTQDAGTGALGADLDVSAGTPGEKINPSVGGDPYFSGSTYHTVVWERVWAAGSDDDIHCRQVSTAGVLLGTGSFAIDNTSFTLDSNPRISKSCQGPGTHHVVWERMNSSSDADVFAAELDWAGTITLPSTLISGSEGASTLVFSPACSPIDNSGSWLLVYELAFVTDHDVFARHMTGLTTNSSLNVSEREGALGSGTWYRHQRSPVVDTDGSHFTCAYSEQFQFSLTDYDLFAATLDLVGGSLRVGEFHQGLAASTTHEDYPALCSQQAAGGAGNVLAILWSDTGGTNLGDIEGAFYGTSDFTKLCFPGNEGVMACPCANPATTLGRGCNNSSATGGASLQGSGNASIAADTALFTTAGEKPTATSIVMQGPTLLGAGVAFGQGVRCVGGALKRLYTKTAAGGSISAPAGGDPSVHARSAALGDPLAAGSLRYYLVYYRDPSVLGGCSAGSTFNATDTLQVLWRP